MGNSGERKSCAEIELWAYMNSALVAPSPHFRFISITLEFLSLFVLGGRILLLTIRDLFILAYLGSYLFLWRPIVLGSFSE